MSEALLDFFLSVAGVLGLAAVVTFGMDWMLKRLHRGCEESEDEEGGPWK